MCKFLIFVIAFLIAGCDSELASQAKTLRSVEKTSQMAINFNQGDMNSLIDAEDYFSPDGWNKFIDSLTGYLDKNGAPNFSQSFNKSGESLDVRRENGVLYFIMPGILEHVSENKYGGISKATYLIEIEVRFNENSSKIVYVKNRTCGSTKNKKSCR